MANENICINRFRAGSVSYQQKVIEAVDLNARYFYIRAMRCANMEQQISQIPADQWQKVRLGVQEMEVAEIKGYRPFDGKAPYRLVVSRIKIKDRQTGPFHSRCLYLPGNHHQ